MSVISIHAPRAGRDAPTSAALRAMSAISIHAPRAGRDGGGATINGLVRAFQSTRPARGATTRESVLGFILGISIHAPRAGRDLHMSIAPETSAISIHAPRAGRDIAYTSVVYGLSLFQSTRPARGATLLAGDFVFHHNDFNPRAPRGARHSARDCRGDCIIFQSTRPARGATRSGRCQPKRAAFQSTRPARGATPPSVM